VHCKLNNKALTERVINAGTAQAFIKMQLYFNVNILLEKINADSMARKPHDSRSGFG
jgi:hypothetical protein